jgi:hypothetical protein
MEELLMPAANRLLITSLAVTAALVVGACASVNVGGSPGPAVAAPEYRVGDRWVYHIVDGYRAKIVWDETHEVTAIGADGITVKVTAQGATFNGERIEKLRAPGVVLQGAVYEDETNLFDPPLIRYQFPLATGERWNQRVVNVEQEKGPYGGISRSVTVGGYEKITTPAGTFDAIGMRVFMQMDDETFWRWPTQCNYLVWYAPAIGASVREQKRSQWRDKGGQDDQAYHPGQNATIELISFTRGG